MPSAANPWIKQPSAKPVSPAPTSSAAPTQGAANPWLTSGGASVPAGAPIGPVAPNPWITAPAKGSAPKPTALPNIDWESHYAGAITDSAKKWSVPEGIVRGVLGVETSGDAGDLGAMLSNQPDVVLGQQFADQAKGLGQFMPGTAGTYGLITNKGGKVQDFRSNGTLSIWAAAHYLHDLYEQFQGQPDAWQKAIASYNHGPNNVSAYPGPDWLQHMPGETRAYVQDVIALAKRYGYQEGQPPLPWSAAAQGGRKKPLLMGPQQPGMGPQQPGVPALPVLHKALTVFGKALQDVALTGVEFQIHAYQNELHTLFDLLMRSGEGGMAAHIARSTGKSPESVIKSIGTGLHTLVHGESADDYYKQTDFALNQDNIGYRGAMATATTLPGVAFFAPKMIQRWGADVTKWPAIPRGIAEMTAQAAYDPTSYISDFLRGGATVLEGAQKLLPQWYRLSFRGAGEVAAWIAKNAPGAKVKGAEIASYNMQKMARTLGRALTPEETEKIARAGLTQAQQVIAQHVKNQAATIQGVVAHLIGQVKIHWETQLGLEGAVGAKKGFQAFTEGEAARWFNRNHQATLASRWSNMITRAFNMIPVADRLGFINDIMQKTPRADIAEPYKEAHDLITQATTELAYLYGDQPLKDYLSFRALGKDGKGFQLPDDLTPFDSSTPRDFLNLDPASEHPYDPAYFTMPHFIMEYRDIDPLELYGRITGREFKDISDVEKYDPWTKRIEGGRVVDPTLISGKGSAADAYIRGLHSRLNMGAAKIAAHMLAERAQQIAKTYGFDAEAPWWKGFFAHSGANRPIIKGMNWKQLLREYAGQGLLSDTAWKRAISWAQVGYFVNPTVHMNNIGQLIAMRNPALLLRALGMYAHIQWVDLTKGIEGRMKDPILRPLIKMGLLGPDRGASDLLSPTEVSDYGLTAQTKALRSMAEGNLARIVGTTAGAIKGGLIGGVPGAAIGAAVGAVATRPLLHLLATVSDASSRILWPFDEAAKVAMFQHEVEGGAPIGLAVHRTLARLIDYADPSPFARAMRNFFWFTTWKTQMPVAVLRSIIEEPFWAINYARAFPSQAGVPHQSQWSFDKLGNTIAGGIQGAPYGAAGVAGGAAMGAGLPSHLTPGKEIGVGPMVEAFKSWFLPMPTFSSPTTQDLEQYVGPIFHVQPERRQTVVQNLMDTVGASSLWKQVIGQPVVGRGKPVTATTMGGKISAWIENFAQQGERETQYSPVNPKYLQYLIESTLGVPTKQINKSMRGKSPGRL